MRYLNKIVFINSADIKYAEINVDGNVHFIGTQGVGKSTLLRAILFFYNADTLKLGISREKKTFADYYFKYGNSYIIYEVARETGPFCVLAFKSQGKVCFRFLDSAYNKDYFIGADNVAFESPEKIRAALDSKEVHLSRKIDRYEIYRDVLYGNTDGLLRDFSKYSLLESRQYQNIPRTIQNVFLSSKLEAEFIKNTIIMSMNEEDVQIDISLYAHHLKDFEAQLKDIQQFRHPNFVKQAEAVRSINLSIKHLEHQKKLLSGQLGYALQQALEMEPVLLEAREKAEENREKLYVKQADADHKHQLKRDKIVGEIESLRRRLDDIKKKEADYQRKNISQVIERVAAKEGLTRRHENLSQERALLSAAYSSILQKYEALLKEIDNQENGAQNAADAKRNKIESTWMQARDKLRETFAEAETSIRQQHEHKIMDARQVWDDIRLSLVRLSAAKKDIKNTRYYEADMARLQQEINGAQQHLYRLESQGKTEKAQMETLQRQWELEKERLTETWARGKEKWQEKITALQQAIDDIDFKIENSKDSFYGWLNAQYPGWENTIGLVADEKVLFMSDLSPAISKDKNRNFFGVALDLQEINKTVKTLADYTADKEALERQQDTAKKEITQGEDDLGVDTEKLRKKYHALLKEHKDALTENGFHTEQYRKRMAEDTLALNDFRKKAEERREQALAEHEAALSKAAEDEITARQALEHAQDELAKTLKSRKKDLDKRLEEGEEKKNREVADILAELKINKKDYKERRAEVQKNRDAELADKGADTSRIKAIEDEMAVLGAELQYIDNHRDMVAGYYKDKAELFDQADAFKNRKQLCERDLELEEQKHGRYLEGIRKELAAIQDTLTETDKALDTIREDVEAVERFKQTEKYEQVSAWMNNPLPEHKTTQRGSELLDELQAAFYRAIERMDELKESLKKLLGNFSDNNIFGFRTSLSGNAEYLSESQRIVDFLEEDKIDEYEKRVNERYAGIIKLIGRETTDLTAREGDIQTVIHKINRDFEEKNFTGVIKKIELKLEDSANRVVVRLKEIKKFNDENPFDLGGANLFSSMEKDVKNQKAVDLLKQLIKDIHEFKSDFISLSDSFELKFRIEENQNDTGWVEKLSNVGSEGTDILVKAMINIMLLNVFKESASKRFKDFRLHCMMDEIGRLHPANVQGILKFANDRNILLINGSPTENDALAYRHIYKLSKDDKSITRIRRIITQNVPELAEM